MQQIADFYFAFVFFVALLGFIVAIILFFVNKTDSFSSRILACFLVAISLTAINNELMATTFFLRFPHLWRVVVSASFCVPALGYLYVRSVLNQSYRFRKSDFLFFLPAILYPLTLIPFYILPSSEKIKIISTIISNNSLISQEPEGILPAGWAVMTRVLYGLGTNIAQFVLLASYKKRILDNENKSAHNVVIFRWLFFFTLVMSFLYLLLIVIIGFQLTLYVSIWQAVIFSITGTILFICLALLISPAILYGLRGWIQKTETVPVSSIEPTAFTSDTSVPKKQSLTIEKGKLYKAQIENHFAANHPYIKGGYTIAELSKELDIPSYLLSAFINQQYGKNFNELVNEYRVDYFLNLVKQPNLNSQYKLETLGNQAGFNTRASFIRAVKKKTGLTPSDFVNKNHD